MWGCLISKIDATKKGKVDKKNQVSQTQHNHAIDTSMRFCPVNYFPLQTMKNGAFWICVVKMCFVVIPHQIGKIGKTRHGLVE